MSPIRPMKSLLHTCMHLQEGSGRDMLGARAFQAALFSCTSVFPSDLDDSASLAIILRQCRLSWACDTQDSVLMPNALSEELRVFISYTIDCATIKIVVIINAIYPNKT